MITTRGTVHLFQNCCSFTDWLEIAFRRSAGEARLRISNVSHF